MSAARPRLLVVLGPTGSGKSSLAMELAARLDAEIVGCDAFQVYRGLDAATAKPAPEDRARIAHHLVDCVDPGEPFSAASYVAAADEAISGIGSRSRVPLIVGGSGMYLRALLAGLIDSPARDRELQQRLSAIADRGGTARLHRLLARHDPPSARRIAPGDRQRIVRAVEMLGSGLSWSRRLELTRRWSRSPPRYPSLKIGLAAETGWLAERIEQRVDRFLAAGLEDELRGLLESGVPVESNAFKAIGYREMLGVIERAAQPGEVRQAMIRSTRRYAKRQRTWFRREPDVVWLDARSGRDANAARVEALWHGRERG